MYMNLFTYERFYVYVCAQVVCIWRANMFMNTHMYNYIGASAKGMAGRPDA